MGQGIQAPPSPEKSLFDICFLKITGMNPTPEAIGPLGSNCISRVARRALCEIKSGQNKVFRTPFVICSGSAHGSTNIIQMKIRNISNICLC